MDYKESRYNHSGMVGDQVFLYNLVTSSVAVIGKSEYAQVKDCVFSDSDLMRTSVENGFIVPADEDEVEKVLAIQRMNNYSTRFAGFQILPTTACNARCFYCYEQSYKPVCMKSGVAEAVPAFIESYMDMVDDVHVTWFGGEPMLELDRILDLSKKLMDSAERHGVGYTSDMITNATLATPDAVRMLVHDCEVSQVQITLDGLAEEHQRRKAYLTESITFDTVLAAMDAFVDQGAKLLIRLNMDKGNYKDCLELIPLLGERYRGLDTVMLYAAPLYGSGNVEDFYTEADLNEAYKAIFRAMIDAGFIQTLDGLPLNFNNATCSARMINNFVIDPSGDVFKCEHLLAEAAQRIGNVFEGVLFNEALAQWASPDVPRKCRECSFLPSCQAGCYAAEALDFGLERCPHIAFITDAIIDAAGYLLGCGSHADRTISNGRKDRR
mgnify:FL=1